MKILPNGIAILDQPDQLCQWVEESGKLCHDDALALHYLPHIKPGDVVIDAGAAIGDHAIAYAHATGNPANVHAFECNPKMVECLRHNCPGVHVYPFALTHVVGLISLSEIEENFGASFISSYTYQSGTVMVPSVSLDCLRFPKVDFIKWDIEGSETEAVRGSIDTIRRCRPKMIVEIYDAHLKRAGSSATELEKLIVSLGYNVSVLMGNPYEGRYEALCLPK